MGILMISSKAEKGKFDDMFNDMIADIMTN